MATLSLRLPDDIDALLDREAGASARPKSEVVRDAIVEFLARQERDRFHAAIARAASSGGKGSALAIAAEALTTDNESLARAEAQSVHEPPPAYRPRRKR